MAILEQLMALDQDDLRYEYERAYGLSYGAFDFIDDGDDELYEHVEELAEFFEENGLEL